MLSKSGERGDGCEEDGTKSYRFPDRALHGQFELFNVIMTNSCLRSQINVNNCSALLYSKYAQCNKTQTELRHPVPGAQYLSEM